MHNHENIRSILGLTQDELATLLSVTRSQLSMYELGKRGLPVSAKLKLAEKIENAKHLFDNLKIKNRVEKSKIENLNPPSEILKLKKEQFKNNIKLKILTENKIILEKLL